MLVRGYRLVVIRGMSSGGLMYCVTIIVNVHLKAAKRVALVI